MNRIALATSRLFLGLVFLVAGINGIVVAAGLDPFIATSPAAMALFQFTYLLVAEKSIEILCGILLLSNRFVPLALTVLSPLIANIFLLHVFLDHSLLPLAILLVVLHVFLLHSYRESFKPLLQPKSTPAEATKKPFSRKEKRV